MPRHRLNGILILVGTVAVGWTLMGYGGATGNYSPLWVLPFYVVGLVSGLVLLLAGRHGDTKSRKKG